MIGIGDSLPLSLWSTKPRRQRRDVLISGHVIMNYLQPSVRFFATPGRPFAKLSRGIRLLSGGEIVGVYAQQKLDKGRIQERVEMLERWSDVLHV